MALADPPSDSSGKARTKRPAAGGSEPTTNTPRQGGTRGKEKLTGSKAGTHVKPRTAAGKRVIAMPEKASAEMATEHEEVNMATDLEKGEPLEATGETVEHDTASAVEQETAKQTAAHAHAATVAGASTAHETPAGHSDANAAQANPEVISAYAGSSLERAPEPARFNIFIIDSGWNPTATQILRENLALIRELNPSDGTFLLDRDRSISVLRRHPALIGRDPIISVHDLDMVDPGSAQYGAAPARVHGFRLHLGLVKTEEKIKDALEMFVRFLRRHRASRNLEKDVREKLRKEGLTGAIEIMGHGVELFRG